MASSLFSTSLDTLCAALCEVMGIAPPAQAAPPNRLLCTYASEAFAGRHADRVLLYNPDAIGAWIADKYVEYLAPLFEEQPFPLEMQTVMPSVTPVCFGTMYTGVQPAIHGIRSYEKPVIRTETLFDALLAAGKRPAIVADNECSIGKIFRERNMDYFCYDSLSDVNAKAAELILADRHDLIVVYNGNYDAVMHKNGPEAPISLAALRENAATFAILRSLIRTHWRTHNTLLGFAPDHGCHAIDGGCGSHGLDMPEDLNIRHYYLALPRAN